MADELKKVKLQNGMIVAIPLFRGGWGTAVVASKGTGKRLLFYLFGPRRESPEVESFHDFNPDDAVFIARGSELGITYGEWPILRSGWSGRDETDEWMVCAFGANGVKGDMGEFRTYSRKGIEVGTGYCPIEIRDALPPDGYFGHGAILSILTEIISPRLGATPLARPMDIRAARAANRYVRGWIEEHPITLTP